MSVFFKILKINLLSILAFPLFLLAFTSKMLAKALEKALVLLGAGAAILGLLLVNLIINNFLQFLQAIGTFLAILIIFGAIVVLVFMVIFLLGSLASAFFALVLGILLRSLDAIFDFSHNLYSKLFDICKSDYQSLSRPAGHKWQTFACIFFHLLRAFNWLVVKFLLFAFPISIGLSLLVLAYSFFTSQHQISQQFGLGLWQYLNLFPKVNMVFAILYFVIMVGALVVILISLGIEWTEWGQLLQYSTQNYADYRQVLFNQSHDFQPQDMAVQASSLNNHLALEYIEEFKSLIENAETLQQQVDAALNLQYDSSLLYDLGEYFQLLNHIQSQVAACPDTITYDDFESQFIPLITKAKMCSNQIIKKILFILEKHQTATGPSSQAPVSKPADFFGGCTSLEEVKRRYRALSKIYHPDANGHAETFTSLQDQYQQKLTSFQTE